ADVRLGEKRRVLRQRPDDVANVDEPELVDLLRTDHRKRLRRIETAPHDARARDDDLFLRLIALSRDGRRIGRRDADAAQNDTDGATKSALLEHGPSPLVDRRPCDHRPPALALSPPNYKAGRGLPARGSLHLRFAESAAGRPCPAGPPDARAAAEWKRHAGGRAGSAIHWRACRLDACCWPRRSR